MKGITLPMLALALAGCTSQFALGPATWSAAPPVIPGFTAIPLGGGGFVEEPNSMLQPPAPAEPAAASIDTVREGLKQAQETRMLVRQLAR